jgi:hypothetical protein
MSNPEETIKALTHIVSRQQLAIHYISTVLPHLSSVVYARNPAASPERRALDELTASDLTVGLEREIDALREQLGLLRMFNPE